MMTLIQLRLIPMTSGYLHFLIITRICIYVQFTVLGRRQTDDSLEFNLKVPLENIENITSLCITSALEFDPTQDMM